jgi:hypothetical protein
MYLTAMEERAREDIAAAVAAHHELGRDYDGAVAESLVDRIGAEIDKRVEARFGQGGGKLARRAGDCQLRPATGPSWAMVALGLGSIGLGIGFSAAWLGFSENSMVANPVTTPGLVALIWVIIGVINVAYARGRL